MLAAQDLLHGGEGEGEVFGEGGRMLVHSVGGGIFFPRRVLGLLPTSLGLKTQGKVGR
jgi:hypothetical protein